jgi:hypothetical protein
MGARTNGMAGLRLGAVAIAVSVGSCGSPSASDADALFSCENETRAQPYSPGVTRVSESGAWQAELVESDPGPPIKGTNTWTVKLMDGAGVPQDDVKMTVSPYMPDHVHPSTVKAVATPQGGGVYVVKPVYLYMPGYWEVTLDLPPGGPSNSVVFPVCIPG